MGIRARVFLIVFFSLAVSIRIAYVIAERDITSTFEEQTIYQLEKQAQLLLVNIDNVSKYSDIKAADSLADKLGNASDSRVTLILNNGVVVGDSDVELQSIVNLDNHANRDEIKEALAYGKGWSSRYSDTIGRQLLYFAITDNNEIEPNIIRISVPYTYLDQVFASLNLSIFLIGIVAFVVCFIASTLIFNYTYKNLSELENAVSSLAKGPIKNKDKEILPLEGLDEFSSVARSITQVSEALKNQVRLIAKQRNQFGSVLDDLGEGVIVFNDLAEITYHNDQALRILNLKTDINNKTLEELNIKAIGNLYDIASKKKKSNKEFEIDLGNGSTRWVLASMNQSNTAKQYILVVHDITQLRKLDSMRRDFISNVSHELRTPVSVIMANSETLLSGALDNKADAENFSKAILHNAERLSEMVSDLIDLSRIEYGELKLEFEKVNINQSILRALDAIKGLAAKKEISLNFDEYEDEFIRVDINAIDRILINLLDNAISFSQDNQKIEICIEETSTNLLISVKDEGPGFAETSPQKIFKRFYSNRPSSFGKHSGLGLNIVKNIVQLHKGTIAASNRINTKGAQVEVLLPKLS